MTQLAPAETASYMSPALPLATVQSAPVYAEEPLQVEYAAEEPSGMWAYAAAGALLVGAVAAARGKPATVAEPDLESATDALRVATLAVSGHPASQLALRAPAPQMFYGGEVTADPRQNFKSKTAAKSLLKTGKSATVNKKKVGKSAISTKRVGSTFVNVDGREYVEVNTFIPQYDEVGVLPPLGRWDPLQIREQGPARYRRFVEMEIKHGRLAMAGFLGAITTYSGVRWPGYLSTSENIKFSDIPGGPIASWAALPTAAWFQIVIFISFCEINFLKQDPEKEPGNVVPEGIPWARYPDGYDVWLGDGSTKQVGEEELFLGRTWKLNAERNNGRAAMMGITGMLIHEALTGNPVFPIGETL